MPTNAVEFRKYPARGSFIGGSDARIIMGGDDAALLRLWREKRGDAQPPDYSRNLLVQLGVATEGFNRRWYERTTGNVIKDVQTWIHHPVIRWTAAAHTTAEPRPDAQSQVLGTHHQTRVEGAAHRGSRRLASTTPSSVAVK
jgi:hypothetical protein